MDRYEDGMMVRAGDRVQLHSLTKTELNGLAGWVQGKHNEERWKIKLDDGRELAFRAANLRVHVEELPKTSAEQKKTDNAPRPPSNANVAQRETGDGGNPGELAEMLVKASLGAAKRHWMVSSGWVIGLLICLLFNGLAVSPENERAYSAKLGEIDTDTLLKAEQAEHVALQEYSAVKGWFGSCSGACISKRSVWEKANRKYVQIKSGVDAQISEAKSKVGVFSTYGVSEVRELFWKRFAAGKGFAQRSTMWDALFMGIGSMGRDEGLASYILRLVVNMLINFTVALFGTTMWFLWSVWAVIKSFNPSTFEAVVFFGFCALAAIAFVTSWLIGLYTVTVGTVYVVAKTVGANMRLENGGARRGPRGFVHNDPGHYGRGYRRAF